MCIRDSAKACAAILRGVKEPVELENHLRHLSVETGFSKEVLMQQIGAAPPPKVVTAAKRCLLYTSFSCGKLFQHQVRAFIAHQFCGLHQFGYVAGGIEVVGVQ